MRRYKHSLREYLPSVAKHWWATVMGVAFGVFGWLLDVNAGWRVPGWVWGASVFMGLAIAQFLAFHKVRVQRDTIIHQSPYVNGIELHKSSGRVCTLKIQNLGAAAVFYATAKVYMLNHGQSLPIKLLWAYGDDQGLRIAHRDWGLIQFIAMDIKGQGVPVTATLPCATFSGHGFNIDCMRVLVRDNDSPENNVDTVAITITVTSEPEMPGGSLEETYYVAFNKDLSNIDIKSGKEILFDLLYRPFMP